MMHVSIVNFNNHIRYNRLIRFNNESEGQTDRVKSWDLSDLKSREYNEFVTISLWNLPPTINSEKCNRENWSESIYPPSLKK